MWTRMPQFQCVVRSPAHVLRPLPAPGAPAAPCPEVVPGSYAGESVNSAFTPAGMEPPSVELQPLTCFRHWSGFRPLTREPPPAWIFEERENAIHSICCKIPCARPSARRPPSGAHPVRRLQRGCPPSPSARLRSEPPKRRDAAATSRAAAVRVISRFARCRSFDTRTAACHDLRQADKCSIFNLLQDHLRTSLGPSAPTGSAPRAALAEGMPTFSVGKSPGSTAEPQGCADNKPRCSRSRHFTIRPGSVL
jgi:hypothetical protein